MKRLLYAKEYGNSELALSLEYAPRVEHVVPVHEDAASVDQWTGDCMYGLGNGYCLCISWCWVDPPFSSLDCAG
jgi:hypothetical protein